MGGRLYITSVAPGLLRGIQPMTIHFSKTVKKATLKAGKIEWYTVTRLEKLLDPWTVTNS